MRVAIVTLALGLASCAITYRPIEVGPGRYQISAMAAPVRGGIAGAQHQATQAAADYCRSLNKQINVISTDTGHEFPVNGTAVVTFDCH